MVLTIEQHKQLCLDAKRKCKHTVIWSMLILLTCMLFHYAVMKLASKSPAIPDSVVYTIFSMYLLVLVIFFLHLYILGKSLWVAYATPNVSNFVKCKKFAFANKESFGYYYGYYVTGVFFSKQKVLVLKCDEGVNDEG